MLSPSEAHVSSLVSGFLGSEVCLFESNKSEDVLGVNFNENFFIGFNDPFILLRFGFHKGFKVALSRKIGKVFVGMAQSGEELKAVFSGEPKLKPNFSTQYNVGACLFLDDRDRLFIQAGFKTFECQFLGEEMLIMNESEEVLPVTITLGTLEMTLSELLAMRPGQMIELPEEAALTIGGVKIAKGKVSEGKFEISHLTPKLYLENSDKNNIRMEVI